MSDYTYLRPNDPAAEEAALVEAMHAQAAPVLDLEYTFDGPPVQLVRPGELSALRAERDALRIEAERLLRWQEKANAAIDALRADIDLLTGWIDAVTGGLSVQELAQLADVAAEVRQRWGLEPE